MFSGERPSHRSWGSGNSGNSLSPCEGLLAGAGGISGALFYGEHALVGVDDPMMRASSGRAGSLRGGWCRGRPPSYPGQAPIYLTNLFIL